MDEFSQFSSILLTFVRNPTVENAKYVSNSLTDHVIREICFTGRQDMILTSMVTAIGELNVRYK